MIVKSTPFRVRMEDQQAIQPLELVKDIELRIEGTMYEATFLILDVGTFYSMLLG